MNTKNSGLMRILPSFIVFLVLFSFSNPLCGQSERGDYEEWQQQILDVVDTEELTESSYETLLTTLMDLSMDRYYHRLDSLYGDSLRHHLPGSHHTLMLRSDRTLEQRAGYRDGTYAGDPWHHSLRYRLEAGSRWSAGLALDKDGGEAWRRRIPWADSYSLFVQYRRSPQLRILAGNYRLHLGQGLLVNQQFSMGKGLQSRLSRTPLLSPHGAPSEGDRMQGVAMEYRVNDHLSLLPFVSARQIDGSLKHDTLTTWTNDGQHRTPLERSHRNTAWLTDMGLHAAWQDEWMEVGANVLYSQFQHDYVRAERTYNPHVFRGHQLLSGSVDYLIHWYQFWLMGEVAVDDHGAMAASGSLRRSIGEEWKAAVLWRVLGDKYRQLHGSTVSESSQMQGERGLSLLLEGSLGRHWTLSALADYWHFTQPQYGIYAPSRGAEGQLRLVYQRSRLKVQGNYRLKWKAKNDSHSSSSIPEQTTYFRHSLDGLCVWQLLPSLALRTQLHSRLYSSANVGGCSVGISGSQAAEYCLPRRGWKSAVQFTWFHTDDYETRLYMSEPSVLYGFDLPMLYGRGQRVSANLQYDLTSLFCHEPNDRWSRWIIEAKYSLMHYADHRDAIGTGPQEIRGSSQQNLWLQLRMSW